VKVWVIFRPTSTTVRVRAGMGDQSGAYMTQKEAQNKGNRPAFGKYCE